MTGYCRYCGKPIVSEKEFHSLSGPQANEESLTVWRHLHSGKLFCADGARGASRNLKAVVDGVVFIWDSKPSRKRVYKSKGR